MICQPCSSQSLPTARHPSTSTSSLQGSSSPALTRRRLTTNDDHDHHSQNNLQPSILLPTRRPRCEHHLSAMIDLTCLARPTTRVDLASALRRSRSFWQPSTESAVDLLRLSASASPSPPPSHTGHWCLCISFSSHLAIHPLPAAILLSCTITRSISPPRHKTAVRHRPDSRAPQCCSHVHSSAFSRGLFQA